MYVWNIILFTAPTSYIRLSTKNYSILNKLVSLVNSIFMIKIQKSQSIIFTETKFEYLGIRYYYVNTYVECYFIFLFLSLKKSEISTFIKKLLQDLKRSVKNHKSYFRQPFQNLKSFKNVSRIFPKLHSKIITLEKTLWKSREGPYHYFFRAHYWDWGITLLTEVF